MNNNLTPLKELFAVTLLQILPRYDEIFQKNYGIFEIGCFLLFYTENILDNINYNLEERDFIRNELLQDFYLILDNFGFKTMKPEVLNTIIKQRVYGHYELYRIKPDIKCTYANVISVINHDKKNKGKIVQDYLFDENLVSTYGNDNEIVVGFNNDKMPELVLAKAGKIYEEEVKMLFQGDTKTAKLIVKIVLFLLVIGVVAILAFYL